MERKVILIQDYIGKKCATCMYSECLRDEAGRKVMICWRYARAVNVTECTKYKRSDEIIKKYEEELVLPEKKDRIPFVRLDEIIISVKLRKDKGHNKKMSVFVNTYSNRNVLIGEYLFGKRSVNIRTFVGHTVQEAKDIINTDNDNYLERVKHIRL